MTIQGFFDPTDPTKRPWLRAIIHFPRLGVSRPVDFEIDTGADVTMLAWGDRIGFPDELTAGFENYQSAGGITGSAPFATETAFVMAREPSWPGGWYGYPVNVWVAIDDLQSPPVSVLGRDFMTELTLHMNMPDSIVYFDTPAPPPPGP